MEGIHACKDKGDALFNAGELTQAIEAYSEGLALFDAASFNITDDLIRLSVELLCARGEAYLKAENYEAALVDGETVTMRDEESHEGPYICGRAYMGLKKYHDARDYLLDAAGLCHDRTEKRKILRISEDAGKHAGPLAGGVEHFVNPYAAVSVHPWWIEEGKHVCDVFEEHLASDDAFVVPDSYEGPRLSRPPKLDEIKAMIQYFKTTRKQLHPRYAATIALDACKTFRDVPTLVDIPVKDGNHITVCGDIHGQFFDLLHIFDINGLPAPDNPYLFNGDFVDRGSYSCEVILTLFAFRALYPTSLYMARGNHETESLTRTYGFSYEVSTKYSPAFDSLMTEIFCYLPLAHVLRNKIFVVHGGLSAEEREDGTFIPCTLDDIRKEYRFCQPNEDGSGIMNDLLWSDPQELEGKQPTRRRAGYFFGPDITRSFLSKNKLSLVVRSHEVKMDGYEIQHNGLLVTLFSAPNYCGDCGNLGAYIKFTAPKMEPVYTTFEYTP